MYIYIYIYIYIFYVYTYIYTYMYKYDVPCYANNYSIKQAYYDYNFQCSVFYMIYKLIFIFVCMFLYTSTLFLT